MRTRTLAEVFELDVPPGALVLEAVSVDGPDLVLTLASDAESFRVRTTPTDAGDSDFVEALQSVCGERVDLTEADGEAILVTLEPRDGEWIWDEIFGLE